MNYPAPFSKNQNAFFWRCFDSWFNVAEGGKRGGKNVLITMAYCAILEKHPSKLHLIAGVSTTTARLNILDCDGYGMMNYFEGRCRMGQYQNRDCLYIKTPAGEKIVLVSGGGKDRDERLIKGNTYGTAYITEANECHPNFIQEVFDRTISSPDRKVFHDLNPKAEGHWYYNILKFHEQQQDLDPAYGYNYGHFTIADNMSVLDDQLRKILRTYDKSSVWYARDILGQRKAAEGLVYPMFDNIVPTIERHYEKYYISMDYGIQNPTAMILWGLCDGVWYAVKEYYHSGRETNAQKTDQQYYDELEKLAGDMHIKNLIIDPSATSFIALCNQKKRFKVWRANNDVIDGIQHTAQALSEKKILFNDCCGRTLKEFKLYSWDEKAGEDKPIKENDHAMDSVRYFVSTTQIWRKKQEYKSIFPKRW